MPFKSEAQRRFMWAKHPEIAKRWAHGEHRASFRKMLGKMWKQARHQLSSLPPDYTKKTQGQPLTGKHVLQHGTLPNVKTARFANFEMKQYSEMEVNFLKEGWYSTNGKEYFYPWDVIERDAETFKGKEFYLNHNEQSGTEMGLITDVYPKEIGGQRWMVAKVKIPEANFTKGFLERVQNGLIKEFSSTHDFIVDPESREPAKVQKLVGKGISSVKEGEVPGTGILDFKRGIKSAAYKKEQKEMISKLWKNSRGGLNG